MQKRILDMGEYGLTKDGITVSEIRKHETPPVYTSDKKPWIWLPLTRAVNDRPGVVVDLDAGTIIVSTAPIPAEPPRKWGSFVEFMDIFTPAQQAAIDIAAVPGSPLSILLKRGMASNEINVGSDEVLNALTLMKTAGLITTAEKTKIKNWDFDA